MLYTKYGYHTNWIVMKIFSLLLPTCKTIYTPTYKYILISLSQAPGPVQSAVTVKLKQELKVWSECFLICSKMMYLHVESFQVFVKQVLIM